MNLSTICKIIRERMRISQKTLANMIGTNQTEISFIERGFVPSDNSKVQALYKLYENVTKAG